MTNRKNVDLEKSIAEFRRIQEGWKRPDGKSRSVPDMPPVGAYSEDNPEAHRRNRETGPCHSTE